MLEIQNGQSSLSVRMGPVPIGSSSGNRLARANMASGFFDGKILISGGFAQPADPFPNYASLVTLNANRDGVTTSTNPAGYDGTSTHGSAIGDRLWIAMGHDGSYRNYLKSRVISTGLVTGSNSAPCPGPVRINSIICANAVDEVYYGGGYNPTQNWLSDWWIYKPSNNSWTAKASIPNGDRARWFTDAIKGPDGLIYGGYDLDTASMHRYNPATDTWSKTSTFFKFLGSGPGATRPLIDAALAVAGKYVLFFQRGTQSPNEDKLFCYRYDTVNDTWDALEMPSRVALYSARVSVEPEKDRLYLYGGALAGEGTTPFDKSTKNTVLYFYELSKFM